ncbi:MAG: trypsin-like serine protease [Ramlibacter sp.]
MSASKADRPDPFLVKLPAAARRPLDLRRGPGIPVQVGIARDVTATASGAAMSRAFKWRQAAGRSAASVSFTSEGAAGLRLGLVVRELPADALVRGYVQDGDIAFEVPASTILEAIRRNRDAGDVSEAARTWWTPLVESDEVTLEISLPEGSPADAVDVSVPRLSHLQVKAGDLNNTAKIGQAGSCEVDVRCVADSDASSRATARMVFTVDGGSYLCTGTLLNDSSSSGIPYFLSANHCVSNQTSATSLITYWFYRSTSCNSGILDGTYRVLHSGATLLYASSNTDTSFMKLNGTPPAGAVFAGWSLDAPTVGADVAGVHHPEGDLQKYSQGSLSAFANCTGVDATDSFSCSVSSASTATFMNASWQSGTTESGSSGSGLFAAGGSRYLIGQLYGGSASCTFRSGTSWYGRFDKAYFAALSRWLSPAGSAQDVTQRTAVYRFYNATTGAHFFTTSAAERDGVIANYPVFRYEGVGFYAYGTQVAGSSPVYRFYNSQTGRHFYTMSPAERDLVISGADFTYEGASWYAQESSGGSATAMYRFYSNEKSAHFYTVSAAEKDWLVQVDSSWALEGIAYYAWTTQ